MGYVKSNVFIDFLQLLTVIVGVIFAYVRYMQEIVENQIYKSDLQITLKNSKVLGSFDTCAYVCWTGYS